MKDATATPCFFVFELTKECNSNCSFCYNVWKSPDNSYPSTESLSAETGVALVEKLIAECKGERIPLLGFALAGGEPLLSPHLFDIATHLIDAKLPVNLATNGILLNREVILRCREIGLKHFEISLPATDEKSYVSLTDSSDVATVRANLLLLKELHPKAKVTIAITITKENLAEIAHCIDMAIAFSADTIVLNRFVPGGMGETNNQRLTPSHLELARVLAIANEKSGHFDIPIVVTIPIENCLINHEQFPNLSFGTCSCGETKWVIDPAGNLRICEQHPQVLGNLRTESFTTLAKREVVSPFRKAHRFPHCESCEKVSSCGGGCRFQ